MQAICCTDNQKFDFEKSSHTAKELLGEKEITQDFLAHQTMKLCS